MRIRSTYREEATGKPVATRGLSLECERPCHNIRPEDGLSMKHAIDALASRKLKPQTRHPNFVDVPPLAGPALTIAGLSFAALHTIFREAIVTSFAEARLLDCTACHTNPRQARGGLQQQNHARIDIQ